jgi:hypothetical protein
LHGAVASVLDEPMVAELVLVDNGNPDDAFADLPLDPRLRVITGHGNVGFAAGVHLGVAASSAPLLLILNPDCVVPTGVLPALIDALAREPQPWIASPLVRGADGREQAGCRRRTATPWRSIGEALQLWRLPGLGRWRISMVRERAAAGLNPVDALSGAFMLLQRETWTTLGGLDRGYFLHVEDLDLCLRVQRIGGRCLVHGALSVVHVKGTSDTPAWTVERHKIRGFWRYFRRHFPGPMAAVAIAVVAAALAVRTGLRAVAARVRPER